MVFGYQSILLKSYKHVFITRVGSSFFFFFFLIIWPLSILSGQSLQSMPKNISSMNLNMHIFFPDLEKIKGAKP